jgi:hypothetical protein
MAELRGMSRAAAYREVRAGKCPVPIIRGARLTIPTAALLRLLGIEDVPKEEAKSSARPNSWTPPPSAATKE